MKIIFRNLTPKAFGERRDVAGETISRRYAESYLYLQGCSEENYHALDYNINWSPLFKGLLIKEFTNNPDDPPFNSKLVRSFEDLKLFFKESDNNLDDFKEIIEDTLARETLRNL